MDAIAQISPGARLRTLLAAPGITVTPGVYDGFSLRLVEQAGYKTAAISGAEGVEKIRAAAEARRDPDFVIKARTDATAIHGVKEAIRRLTLYAEAGADLLFADALLTAEDIATVAKNVSKPLTVNMGFGIRQRPTTPLLSAR